MFLRRIAYALYSIMLAQGCDTAPNAAIGAATGGVGNTSAAQTGGASSGGSASGDSAVATLPYCAALTNLASADASRAECGAARVYLSCSSSSETMTCMTDNLSECPAGGPIIIPSVTFSDCKNLCNSDEYVMACGGVGPGEPAVSTQLPTACRALPPNPGGVSYYCCPCDS
jgi:hypothetical protein